MKIDQTFVRGLPPTGPEFVLLEMMIGLAHRLGFRVVAEGIETREVAVILESIGCEEGQGFLFSPRSEVTEFGQWLTEQRRGPAPLRKTG